MKFSKCGCVLILSLFVFTCFTLLAPLTAFCQAEKLGIVKYTSVPGWEKTLKENVVSFSEFNKTTGGFCIITLYGSAPGTGTPQGDFDREWKKLVVSTLDKANADPTTEKTIADGWTILAGGSAIETQIGKAGAYLSVISGFGKTVSILAVFSDPAYVTQIDAFMKGVDIDKPTAPQNNTAAVAPATLDRFGNIFIPQPTRQLTTADLAGQWGENPGRISTAYFSSNTGNYVGTDRLAFTTKWTFDSGGSYLNDFFEVRNGKKLSDVTNGSFTITGRLLAIKHKGTAKYVIRGWIELPDITILKLAGPWFDDQPIPDRIFNDFGPDSEYLQTKKWVRRN